MVLLVDLWPWWEMTHTISIDRSSRHKVFSICLPCFILVLSFRPWSKGLQLCSCRHAPHMTEILQFPLSSLFDDYLHELWWTGYYIRLVCDALPNSLLERNLSSLKQPTYLGKNCPRAFSVCILISTFWRRRSVLQTRSSPQCHSNNVLDLRSLIWGFGESPTIVRSQLCCQMLTVDIFVDLKHFSWNLKLRLSATRFGEMWGRGVMDGPSR